MRLDRKKVMLQMAKLCINQQKLADRAECSRQTISTVLNGRNCHPELLGRIAKALEVEPAEIVEDNE